MTPGQEMQVQEKRELQKNEESTIPVRAFVPTTDIYETDQALTVVMEMPGVREGQPRHVARRDPAAQSPLPRTVVAYLAQDRSEELAVSSLDRDDAAGAKTFVYAA